MDLTVPKPVITAPLDAKVGSSVRIAATHNYSLVNSSRAQEQVSVVAKLWIQYSGTPNDIESNNFALAAGAETEGAARTRLSWTPATKNNYLVFASTKVTLAGRTIERQQQWVIVVST